MSTGVTQRREGNTDSIYWLDETPSAEVMAFCPGCKALETVSFGRRGMMATRRFTQKDGKVYHHCRSGVPCRLYSLSQAASLRCSLSRFPPCPRRPVVWSPRAGLRIWVGQVAAKRLRKLLR